MSAKAQSAAPTAFYPCLPVPSEQLHIQTSPRTFALRVGGTHLLNRHIQPGDVVVCEHGRIPSQGSLVAALVDNESVLGVYTTARGTPHLETGDPSRPSRIPVQDLVLQGTVTAVMRSL